jgi:hypothetical protein
MGHLDHVSMPYLHCWLETKAVVVDLIQTERFFQKTEYYSRMKIDSDLVVRYTLNKLEKKRNTTNPLYWEFWDLPAVPLAYEQRWKEVASDKEKQNRLRKKLRELAAQVKTKGASTAKKKGG